MKKQTKQEKTMAKSKGRTFLFLTIGIAALLIIFFTLGVFITKPNTGRMTYNNFEFIQDKKTGFWSVNVAVTTQEGKRVFNLETRYNPKELEGIPVDRDVMNFFHDENGKEIEAVYLTIDPNNNNNSALALGAYDLSANLAKVFGVSVEAACTANTTAACAERPIINCNDTYPVIYIKNSESESVDYLPHRCIVLSGKDVGMVKAVDRLLFQWYGIMQ